MSRKTLIFMRHGQAVDYSELSYEKFMEFMLNRIDPPLSSSYQIQQLPDKIDMIYYSPSRRAEQTAQLVLEKFKGIPTVKTTLLQEIQFSEDIITIDEFQKCGWFNDQARKIILQRWFQGENRAESFLKSINKVEQLNELLNNNNFENILVITHSWYLRLIDIFYEKRSKNITTNISLDDLIKAHIYNYGEMKSYKINGRLNINK